jgi:stearoyl-CoA desaturase (Delta-9 desaturase)
LKSIVAQSQKIARSHLVGMTIIHLAALLAFWIEPKAEYFAVAAFFYILRILGITAGFHRFFTHKAFSATTSFQFFLALIGTWAGQGPLKRWVANHRLHHYHVETKLDPHSPMMTGFWYAHIGWLFDPKAFERGILAEEKFRLSPVLEWMSRNFNFVFAIQIPLLYLLGETFGTSGNAWIIYGFFLSLVFSYHATFAVNSICHIFGKTHELGRDQSRNNWIVGILTLGEGWHANHHYQPSSARQGFGWQIDLTYVFLKLCQKLKLIGRLK